VRLSENRDLLSGGSSPSNGTSLFFCVRWLVGGFELNFPRAQCTPRRESWTGPSSATTQWVPPVRLCSSAFSCLDSGRSQEGACPALSQQRWDVSSGCGQSSAWVGSPSGYYHGDWRRLAQRSAMF